jgi:hypothetical protein
MYTSPIGAELPAPGTIRWIARRKAAIVAAVRSGAIGLAEACRRYELSEEEFVLGSGGSTPTGSPACGLPACKFIAMLPCPDG